MSLINCEVCEGALSEVAVTCVHCGHPRLVTKIDDEIHTDFERAKIFIKKERERIFAVIMLLLIMGIPFYLPLLV